MGRFFEAHDFLMLVKFWNFVGWNLLRSLRICNTVFDTFFWEGIGGIRVYQVKLQILFVEVKGKQGTDCPPCLSPHVI